MEESSIIEALKWIEQNMKFSDFVEICEQNRKVFDFAESKSKNFIIYIDGGYKEDENEDDDFVISIFNNETGKETELGRVSHSELQD